MQDALLTDGIWRAERDGESVAFTSVGGREADTLTLTWTDLATRVHSDDQAQMSRLRHAVIAGDPVSLEFRIAAEAGKCWQWLRMTGGAGTGTADIGGILCDITDLKDGQAKALEAAARVNRFASAVSHDLQAPLRHIAIYSDMMRTELKEQIPQPQQAMLQIIEEKALNLQGYVKVVMGFARETYETQVASVDVDAALRKAYSGLCEEIEDLDAVITLPPASHAKALADEQLLTTVIAAVFSNTLHHRHEGHAKVTVSIGLTGGRLQLFIADDGPGIKEELRSRIFDPFWSHPVGGNARRPGMGLALAKMMLLPLDADIRLHASGAEGSTFVIDLPVASTAGSDFSTG